MVHSYSPGGGNVSSHECTLAPPDEYDWICASFGPFESRTQTANGSVQPFLQSSRQEVPILCNGRPYPPELPLPMGIWTPSNTWFLGPMPKGHVDRFSLFAQLTAECPYTLQWFAHFSLKIALSHGGFGPHVIHGSLSPPESGTQMATWSFQPFLQGSLVWQTDRSRWSTALAYTNWPWTTTLTLLILTLLTLKLKFNKITPGCEPCTS